MTNTGQYLIKCKVCGRPQSCSPNTGRASKWYVMRDTRKGWFFANDGTATCPDHKPEWLDEWRRKHGYATYTD